MQIIKRKYKQIFIISIIMMGLSLGSCEEYLDKAPSADIYEKDVFGNFISFQGFIEELYGCVVNYPQAAIPVNYLFADETLYSNPLDFDNGNYWSQGEIFYGESFSTGNAAREKKVWPLCWYGIRKANIALSKIDLMAEGTQEEKDLIKGQALFFRGWFYFELMRYWGGMPYLDNALAADAELNLPRLNYRETAIKAAKDFEDAAELLPVSWDDTQVGQATLGNNRQRVSKVWALAYQGKTLLFAASPMMNEESTGNSSYDASLCELAAVAFADALSVCDQTGVYQLQSWDTWTDNFWVESPGNTVMPGGTEVIMNSPVYGFLNTRYSQVQQTLPPQMGAGNTRVQVPTHNYIKNYRMANGLPIEDPNSGYDPNDPWTNREPRFYKDIVYDGVQLVKSAAAGNKQYAQLYTGGSFRVGSQSSVTGYYYLRFSPLGCNQWERFYDNFQAYLPYLRLSDVYLMYAEAVLHAYGSASSSVPESITAEQAVNIIRNRAQLPNLASSYTETKDAFMGAIIRERAIELAFEGQRWFDLRRWNLSGDPKYLDKTAIDFDRGPDGKPTNIQERVVVTRAVEAKNNWLPIQTKFTDIYKEFYQNPGW